MILKNKQRNKSLDINNKKDELKHTEGIFPKYLMNDLIRVKLKEIVKLQDIIKKDLSLLIALKADHFQ